MGTTLNKLEYLDETKGQIKTALNQFNVGITDEDTFRSYVDKINNIYNNWEKVTGEGTEVTLTPTKKGRLALIPKGNSEQESTEGRQIFNKNSSYQSAGSIAVTVLDNGVRLTQNLAGNYLMTTFKGKDLTGNEGKRLRISYSIKASGENVPACRIYMLKEDGKYQNGQLISSTIYGNSGSAIIPDDISANPYLGIQLYVNYNGTGVIGNTMDYTDLMVTIDNEDMSYEDFTGGNPAPSPEFPFPIKSVTGNNNVVVNSKNWFKLEELGMLINSSGVIQSNSSARNVIIDTKDIDYMTISGDFTLLGDNTLRIGLCNEYPAINGTGTRQVMTSTGTIDVRNYNYLLLCVLRASSSTFDQITNSFQLELGQEATSYVPYQNQTLPLNLGDIELNKIGNYQDYIYKNNGKWYKKEYILKTTLNGTESSSLWTTGTYQDITRFYYNIASLNESANVCVIANLFKGIAYNDRNSQKYNTIYTNGTNIGIGTSSISTIEALQTLLRSTPLIFYLIRTTPTDIEITDTTLISQLEEIDKMKSYNGTTIITSTYEEGNSQIIINASALKKGSE